ncbi:MAG TPA: nitronate monooxygenase, partial [Blastocatellia bacterium]|nr:nitronate monooxygenase [Blastocatellia bacterium]
MFATNDPAKLNRRDFLEMGAVTLGCMPGGVNLREGIADSPGEEFRTALCDLLGIRYPILQAGMGSGVASPALVAAVSNAGGLGILTGTLVPPDELRQQIRQIRKLTDKPFGVNLILHPKLLPP